MNTKAAEVENKEHDITNLTTKPALNTKDTEVENKITHFASSITTPGFHRLTKISFDARIKEAAKSLTSKSQMDNTFDIEDKKKINKKIK